MNLKDFKTEEIFFENIIESRRNVSRFKATFQGYVPQLTLKRSTPRTLLLLFFKKHRILI